MKRRFYYCSVQKMFFLTFLLSIFFLVDDHLYAMDSLQSVNFCVQELAIKMNIRVPVIIESEEDSCCDGYDLQSILNAKENTPVVSHLIKVTYDTMQQVKSHLDAHYYLAIASLCHELGHAKQIETDSQFVNQIKVKYGEIQSLRNKMLYSFLNDSLAEDFKKCSQLLHEYRQLLYTAELYADVAIPDEKPLLLAMRKDLIDLHNELQGGHYNGRAIRRPEALKNISEIDFDTPMDEECAKAWDDFHKSFDDYHPSAYRRAYMFNERLKKLEAQEHVTQFP